MSKNAPTLLQTLREATKGLKFQSESDYAVKPFVVRANDKGAAQSAEDFVAAKKRDASAEVSESDLDSFFANAVQVQDWQSPEAQANAKKFQALVQLLKANLTDIKVYKIGETEADVYVVGQTTTGELAGVSTKVVET